MQVRVMVDPVKITLILSLPPLTNVKMLHVTLGHTGYYHKFIKGYNGIIATMEKLLKRMLDLSGVRNVKEVLKH